MWTLAGTPTVKAPSHLIPTCAQPDVSAAGHLRTGYMRKRFCGRRWALHIVETTIPTILKVQNNTTLRQHFGVVVFFLLDFVFPSYRIFRVVQCVLFVGLGHGIFGWVFLNDAQFDSLEADGTHMVCFCTGRE